MPSVLQDWVTELPLMMQGTLMTGIRGNDLAHAPKMKPVVRWMRSVLLNNGNPENDFMEVPKLPAVEDFEDELEYMSVHYFRHFLLTLEIIGYKHPEYEVAEIAMDYYLRLVNWSHLAPESHEELDERLSGEPGTTGDSKTWTPPGLVPSRKTTPVTNKQPSNAFAAVCNACGTTTDMNIPYCTNCGSVWSKGNAGTPAPVAPVSPPLGSKIGHKRFPRPVRPVHRRQGSGGYT